MVLREEGYVMLKYWRVLMLLIMVLGSLFAVGMKYYPYGRNGVEIVYVSNTSPASGVLVQGMQITHINSRKVANSLEWDSLTKNLSGTITLMANGREYKFRMNDSHGLGIDVMDMERTNLELGLDLRGGTRIILQPEEENVTKEDIAQVISTLNTRANLFGLKEMKVSSLTGADGRHYVQIEAAGLNREVIEELLSRQGTFRAMVEKPVALKNRKGTMEIGDDMYPVFAVPNTTKIRVGNITVDENGTFELSGVSFVYENVTNNKALFLARAYTGTDIELVYSDPQHSGVIPASGGYKFYFVVLVSEEGAKRFAAVTKGIPSILDVRTGERYLDSRILLYLDNQLVSDLRISSELGGKIYNTPQITGFRSEIDDATQEKLRLQTILRSGALPTTLKTVSVDVLSPTLGTEFISSTLLAAGLAGIAVILVVFIRYRRFKVAVPLVLTGLSEAIIILGIAATNDTAVWVSVLVLNFTLISAAWWKKHEIDIYAWIGAILIPLLGLMSWTIDLPAIAGIVAVIGTGMDDQIIIADETLSGRKDKRVYSLRERIKRAFFIIFGSAATTIAAMTPLMFIGIGLVRGFAITTIVGVLIGILITRPAYAKIIELGFRHEA